MTDQRFAVVIGVDSAGMTGALPRLRHAEDDAEAIFKLLCHTRTGTFDPDDAHLFIGPNTTVEQVKATLMEIMRVADTSDVLVVYFAGHSLTREWGRATDIYLVTPDLDETLLTRNPDAGLRMAYLRRDVLETFPGKALFILDCCRAGTLLPSSGRDVDIVGFSGRQQGPYTAIMACAADEAAREDSELGHGVLTHHLLEAMRGDAADAKGEVTFQGLGNYITGLDIRPEPGYSTQTWGRATVVTRPGPPKLGRHAVSPVTNIIKSASLENPLHRISDSILHLVDQVSRGARDKVPTVENLRKAMEADYVAVLEHTPAGFKTLDLTPGFDGEYVQELLQVEDSLDKLWYGHHAMDDDHSLLCVPLQRSPGSIVILVVMNPSRELLRMGEPLTRVLQTVWRSGRGGSADDTEIHVLTDLRRTFGRLPQPFYQRYRKLHGRVLESYTMVFQPITTIGTLARHVGVHSFEALARRAPEELSAPIAMLDTSRAWGDSMVVERDEIIVRKALSSYARAHHDATFTDTPKPVSVNVAVRSLLSDSYVQTLQEAIKTSELNPEGVTLEISEQDPIKPRREERWLDEPHAYFQKRLVDIGRALKVSFAVDDFGSDHASLRRMAELPLTQIKVDRAVLHHATALDELEFVEKIARHARDRGESHASRVVIVEGVDEHSPVTLRQLWNLNIRHVQGFITQDPAAPTLRQLREDVCEDIAARVRGDDEKRRTNLARGNNPGRRHSLRRSA